MFKALIKMLHPCSTATQEGNYAGTENIGVDPVHRHHHGALERERMAARSSNNKNNEAFIDRIYVIKVPYCLRVTEETAHL